MTHTPPEAFEVIESSVPEDMTLADYRALRARCSRRRGKRPPHPPAADGARATNRPKEVTMNTPPARCRYRRPVLLLIAAAALALVLAEPSLAASEVGKNVGKEIQTWGKAILLGVVGLVAIPVLAKRDVAGGAVVMMLAVIVGGFVFAPRAVQGVISGIWRSIGG